MQFFGDLKSGKPFQDAMLLRFLFVVVNPYSNFCLMGIGEQPKMF